MGLTMRQKKIPMDLAYAESRRREEEGWSFPPAGIRILVCCGLLLGGYFYGVHRGSSLAVPGGYPGVGSSTPAQADNALPVAPSFGEKSAPGDLLARAQLENELLYTDLQSFVCSEHMDRYRGRLNGDNPHRIDTVNAQISFENGVENYSGIVQNGRQRAALTNLTGAWSEGEFGTLLRQTRALLSTQAVASATNADLNGTPAALYSVEVSGKDSPWDLTLNSQQYRVPFVTRVWVSKSSGQILQIARTSTAMPPDSGISEIQWSVNLKPVELEGKTWLLPNTGEYSVLYAQSNRREWNTIDFSDYHRYASRSVIHF